MSWDKTEGGDFGHSGGTSRAENFIRGLNIELANERNLRAKAEAEVERLKKVYATTNDSWKKLQAENIKLRAVVEATKQFMNELDFRGKTHSLDMSNYHGRTIHIKQGESGKPYWLALWSLEQALAELDKEAVKNEKSKP